MSTFPDARPPLPPFTRESAVIKVRKAEDAWNGRDPAKVALAYTPDSRWRNRSEFLTGRDAITAFLTAKWARELDYRLIKDLWAFNEAHIAVRFVYEAHRPGPLSGQRPRTSWRPRPTRLWIRTNSRAVQATGSISAARRARSS